MDEKEIEQKMKEWDDKNPAPDFGPNGDFMSVSHFHSAWCMSGSVPPMPRHEAWVAERRAYRASLGGVVPEPSRPYNFGSQLQGDKLRTRY